MIKMRTYATFEEMHGYESTLEQLINKLKPFSRSSVLFACSVTGIMLKLWKGDEWEKSLYARAINEVFDPLRGDWYNSLRKKTQPHLRKVFYPPPDT